MKRQLVEKRKPYLQEIDLVRAFAIFAVIIVHTTSQTVADLEKTSTWYPLYNFLNIFFKFGTPTFIFFSAFILFYSYGDRGWSNERMKQFYLKRTQYILVPYFLFSLFYFVLIVIMNETFAGWVPLITDFLRDLATGKAYPHLYFVFISLQFYVLFPLWMALLNRRPAWIKHAIWFGLAMQWAFFFWNHYQLDVQYKGSIALSYFSHYFIGAYAGLHYQSLLVRLQQGWKYIIWIAWLIAGGTHVFFYHMYRVYRIGFDTKWFELAWNVHTLLSAFILLHLSVSLKRWLPLNFIKPLRWIGSCSFGIYILHPAVLYFYREWIVTNPAWLYHVMVMFGGILSFAVSFIVVFLLTKYWKKSWILFGLVPLQVRADDDGNRPKETAPHIANDKAI